MEASLIQGKDIIIVGQQPWDVEIGSNCKNIALEFSKHNRVLYVNSPLDRATKWKHGKDARIKKRINVINKAADGMVEIQHNLWNYYPDELIESINWIKNNTIYNWLNKINNKKFARSITKAIKRLGFKNVILFNDNDIFRCFYLKELLQPAISIYYSRDYLLFVDYWNLHGKKLEPELMKKSDICVANSTYLANYCKQYNSNSYYVGQGCDLEVFTNKQYLPVPDDILNLQKPIIGYVGALQSIRLDMGLLEHIANKRPEWDIVLVGPEDEQFKASNLHHIKNVHFLGSKDPEMLPAYINSFNVCLNPQLINQVTTGNYPRKIDEYLAMGKPVVATQTEAMSVFADYTYLCKTFEDYLLNIKQALEEDSRQLQQQRVQFAGTHTWENSVKEIYKAITQIENDENNLNNKPIVIFSNMRFDSPIESTSLFIARSFAKNNPVYYIEYPYTFKDYIKNKKSESFSISNRSLFHQDELITDSKLPNLKRLILPFVFPINFIPESMLYRALLKVNEAIIIKRIKRILNKEGVKDFIFINSFNIYYPGIGKALKPILNIYQCIDPLITPYDLKHGHVSELQLVKESDLVICTSKALFKKQSIINKNTYLVPNAADISQSSKVLNDDLPVHPKLKNIAKPIIGYLGSIERRIDFDLMKIVIDNNPDKSFVFAGPVIYEHIPEWFLNSPGVHICGQIPYEETPQIFKGFDVAIIPFKKDDISDTVFPLKLFEYLGAGLPVVVTDFNNDLKDYTYNTVSFCSDADEFTAALNNILANDNVAKRDERILIAKQNTWEIRTNEIAGLINKNLKLSDE